MVDENFNNKKYWEVQSFWKMMSNLNKCPVQVYKEMHFPYLEVSFNLLMYITGVATKLFVYDFCCV